MRLVPWIVIILSAGGLGLGAGVAPSGLAAPRGIRAAGACTAILQNLDRSQAATAVLDFYKQGGAPPVTVAAPPIPASAAWELVLATTPQLSNGAYGAIASGDRPLAGAARCFWPVSGGDSAYTAPQPGTDVLLPLLAKGARRQTSLVSIQNTDATASAVARFTILSADGAELVEKDYAVMAGRSITLDLSHSPDFEALPPGSYSARLSSTTPVAVQSFVDIEDSVAGVYAFEGVPRTHSAARLVAPAVHAARPAPAAAAEGDRTTWLAVVNAGESSVDLAIAYSGIGGTCAGETFQQGPWTLAPRGQRLVYAGSPPAGADGEAGPLPAGCAAAAELEAPGGRIVGVAVEEVGQGVRAGAYTLPAVPAPPPPPPNPSLYLPFAYTVGNPRQAVAAALPVAAHRSAAAPAQASDWRLNLPTLRRAAAVVEGGPPLSSEVTVMNMAAQTTTVRLSLFDPGGQAIPCGACAAALPPRGAHRWWLSEVTDWPTGTVGSAVIASERPLAATVADLPERGGWDETLYAAVSISQVTPSAVQAASRGPAVGGPAAAGGRRARPPALPLLLTERDMAARLAQWPVPARQYYPFLMR